MENRVYEIQNKDGVIVNTPENIQKAFVEYYTELLGTNVGCRNHVNGDIIRQGSVVSNEQRVSLTVPVTEEEIKKAMWSIDGGKTPGPDGYSSQFYKDNWIIVKEDTIAGIQSFCTSGEMLKQVVRMASWIKRRYKGSRLQQKVLYAFIAGLVYSIWRNRNSCVWEGECEHPLAAATRLFEEIRQRLTACIS